MSVRAHATVLSVQQQALGAAMLRTKVNVLTDYRLLPGGGRGLVKGIESLDEILEPFVLQPEACQAAAVRNLRSILGDARLSATARFSRLVRYLDAYLELVLTLDHVLYPPSDTVRCGSVPTYLPDGLSDLGRNPLGSAPRPRREKIRVNKRALFAQSRDLLLATLERHLGPEATVRQISRELFHHMTNHPAGAPPEDGRSVALDQLYDESYGVCRHHSLYLQVLFQVMGLESRLVKGRLNGVLHAWNAVLLGGRWHILDATNPWSRVLESASDVYLVPMEEAADPSSPIGVSLPGPSGDDRFYRPEPRMAWRVVAPEEPLREATGCNLAPDVRAAFGKVPDGPSPTSSIVHEKTSAWLDTPAHLRAH